MSEREDERTRKVIAPKKRSSYKQSDYLCDKCRRAHRRCKHGSLDDRPVIASRRGSLPRSNASSPHAGTLRRDQEPTSHLSTLSTSLRKMLETVLDNVPIAVTLGDMVLALDGEDGLRLILAEEVWTEKTVVHAIQALSLSHHHGEDRRTEVLEQMDRALEQQALDINGNGSLSGALCSSGILKLAQFCAGHAMSTYRHYSTGTFLFTQLRSGSINIEDRISPKLLEVIRRPRPVPQINPALQESHAIFLAPLLSVLSQSRVENQESIGSLYDLTGLVSHTADLIFTTDAKVRRDKALGCLRRLGAYMPVPKSSIDDSIDLLRIAFEEAVYSLLYMFVYPARPQSAEISAGLEASRINAEGKNGALLFCRLAVTLGSMSTPKSQ